MSIKKTRCRKTRGYGLFTLSATAFTIGVVALSIVSYRHQRDIIMEQVDESLINSAYGAKYIFGNAETMREDASDHTSKTKLLLNQYAASCGLGAIAALTPTKDHAWAVIAGIDHEGILSAGEIRRGDILYPATSPVGQLLIRNQQKARFIAGIPHGEHGSLRIAAINVESPPGHGYTVVVAHDMRDVNVQLRNLVWYNLAKVIFLHLIAFPLVASYNFARIKSDKRMDELGNQLQQDYEKLKARETDLQDAMRDLERFNALTIGRESRIIELKAEVNTLLQQMGQNKRYNVDRTARISKE